MKMEQPTRDSLFDYEPSSPKENSLRLGKEFEDMVGDVIYQCGLVARSYSSRKYQLTYGENAQGIEIKLDRGCTKYGRLSIEIAERLKASHSRWIPSGIYRADKAWAYIQGNESRLWVFPRNILRLLYESGRYEVHEAHGTVRKFYLPIDQADQYAMLKFQNNNYQSHQAPDWIRIG